ncbi:unnamed protein product, partial [Didymodactylos carnosus]
RAAPKEAIKLIIMVFNNDSIKVSHDLSNDIGRLLSLDQQLECGIKSCNVIELSHLFYEYYDNAEGNRNKDKIAGLRWMMNQCFHLDMDKTWSVCDWAQFPLSTAKLSYACNDVTSMMKIYRFLNRHYMNDNNGSSYEETITVSNNTSKFSFVECVMQARPHEDKINLRRNHEQEDHLRVKRAKQEEPKIIRKRFMAQRPHVVNGNIIKCKRILPQEQFEKNVQRYRLSNTLLIQFYVQDPYLANRFQEQITMITGEISKLCRTYGELQYDLDAYNNGQIFLFYGVFVDYDSVDKMILDNYYEKMTLYDIPLEISKVYNSIPDS